MRIVGLARERLQKTINNLTVAEISACRKAANPHARIMIAKSHKEPVMSQQTVIAKAAHVFEGLVELTKRQHNCSRSRAIDIVLKTQTGRDALALAKRCDAASFLKLGDGGLPQGGIPGGGRADPLHDSFGPDYPDPPRARRVGALEYAGSHQHQPDVEDDDELSAAAHAQMEKTVRQMMRDHQMTESKARSEFIRQFPEAWKAAKAHRPVKARDIPNHEE
jgi:hypothetical protein